MNTGLKTLFALALLLLTSCAHEYRPQSGDLLFEVAADSDFSQAITQATAHHDTLKFSHVAIVEMWRDTPYVLEAAPRMGVVRTPLKKFLQGAHRISDKPGVVVMRLAKPFSMEQVILRAKSHIGEAYDWHFRPDNGKMYCSELVYESFRDEDGKPIFSAKPMNFRDEDGHLPAFWVELFERLGEPVPEGVPGTNPNDLAKDTLLNEVWRFF